MQEGITRKSKVLQQRGGSKWKVDVLNRILKNVYISNLLELGNVYPVTKDLRLWISYQTDQNLLKVWLHKLV